jgi:hypothetical protein
MRPLPLLLHVLLSLALVANGIGAAMASAHAGCVHSATAVDRSSVEAAAVAEPPCHGDMAREATAPMDDRPHHDMPGDASSTDAHGSGDDCGSACDCDCTAHCQAALMPPTLLLHPSARITHAETSNYIHVAPALPHPVRPPIG